jgi:hypothetical protein
MMNISSAALLNCMRVGWQVADVAKPVRTIDELTRLVIEVWNRQNLLGADPSQNLHSQLTGLQATRRALSKAGSDERALAPVDERIAVLGSLLTPAPPAPDPLTGSVSGRLPGGQIIGARNPALTPAGTHSPAQAARTLLVAARQVGADDGKEWAATARARLQGQREVLSLVRRRLAGRQEEQNAEQALSELTALVDNRLAALDSTVSTLNIRPTSEAREGASRPRPGGPRPGRSTQARAAAGARRIGITVGQDRRR